MDNTLYIMVGIAGSGKSSYIKENKQEQDIILSSDDLRKEMYGFEDQEHNGEVFLELNKRTKEYGNQHKNVWYDATNINRKRRVALYNEMKNSFTNIKVITVICDIQELFERNNNREERHLPEESLIRMIKNIQIPTFYEAGYECEYYYSGASINETQSIECFKDEAELRITENLMDYNQNNKHHIETLGRHIFRVATYCMKDENAYIAALYHDMGKPFCREEREDGNCTYKNHNIVSSYIFMCDILRGNIKIDKKIIDILSIIESHDYIFNYNNIEEMRESYKKKYNEFDNAFWYSLGLLIRGDRLRPNKEDNNMFNIYYAFAGWLPISFGERKDVPSFSHSDKDEVFFLSYLDYAKDELDNLFDLSTDNKKSYEFDLEGYDIRISTYLDNNVLTINCEYLYLDSPVSYQYSFDYLVFLKGYIEEWIEHKDEYEKNFAYDFEDYKWDNEHWININRIGEKENE